MHLKPFVALVFFALLAGCSSTPEEKPPCPRLVMPPDIALLDRYQNQAGIEQRVARVAIIEASGECSAADNRITLGLNVKFGAQKDRGSQLEVLPVEYFAAILDARDQILAKETLPLNFTFAKGDNAALAEDYLELNIPAKPLDRVASYRVVLGMQMSRADFQRWSDKQGVKPQAAPIMPVATDQKE